MSSVRPHVTAIVGENLGAVAHRQTLEVASRRRQIMPPPVCSQVRRRQPCTGEAPLMSADELHSRLGGVRGKWTTGRPSLPRKKNRCRLQRNGQGFCQCRSAAFHDVDHQAI
jgi:hypothetical protein